MPAKQESRGDVVQAEYDRLANLYDSRWRTYIDATLRIVEQAVECTRRMALLIGRICDGIHGIPPND